MSVWDTFDDTFWLTLSGAFFAFMGLLVRAILKSRWCGMGCVRDVAPPGEEPDNHSYDDGNHIRKRSFFQLFI